MTAAAVIRQDWWLIMMNDDMRAAQINKFVLNANVRLLNHKIIIFNKYNTVNKNIIWNLFKFFTKCRAARAYKIYIKKEMKGMQTWGNHKAMETVVLVDLFSFPFYALFLILVGILALVLFVLSMWLGC